MCLSFCLSVMWTGCAKTAEWIGILYGVETSGGLKYHCIRWWRGGRSDADIVKLLCLVVVIVVIWVFV